MPVTARSLEAVVATDVGVRYGQSPVLEGVTFRAGWGELIAVVGPNGAGKSTLFKALAGVVPHTGRVVLGAGRHPGGGAAGQGSVAYLPQRLDLDPTFPVTVGQLVLTGRRRFLGPCRRPRALDRAVVADALSEVGLSDRAREPIGRLSGGQLQRALVARALAQEAGVLLLDESLSGVDRPNTLDLIGLFTALADGGRTILVATHDLALTRHAFSRCLAVNGRLVADGDPRTVLDSDSLEATFGSGRTLLTAGAP